MNPAALRILDAATRLFIERGYELVGVNEIIATAGVAKATFYSHFKSKETLCVAWLNRLREENEARLKQLYAKPFTAAELVCARYELLASRQIATDYRGCPFSNTAAMVTEDNEVRAAVRAYKTANRNSWREIAARTGCPEAETAGLADTLFLIYSGAITEAQNFRDTWPVTAAREAALRLCRQT